MNRAASLPEQYVVQRLMAEDTSTVLPTHAVDTQFERKSVADGIRSDRQMQLSDPGYGQPIALGTSLSPLFQMQDWTQVRWTEKAVKLVIAMARSAAARTAMRDDTVQRTRSERPDSRMGHDIAVAMMPLKRT